MSNFFYDYAAFYLGQGAINARESATTSPVGVAEHNLRVALIATLTTCSGPDVLNTGVKARSVPNLGGFATLDEYLGTNYAPGPTGAGRQSLGTQVVTHDATNARTEINCDPITWSSLGADANGAKGLLIFFQPTSPVTPTEATNIPILWIDQVSSGTAFPFNGSGGNVTITPNAEGLIQIGNGTIVIPS